MLFNRALTLQLAKKEKPSQVAEPSDRLAPDELITVMMYHATDAAILLGKIYAAKKLIDTGCEIAVIAAKAAVK